MAATSPARAARNAHGSSLHSHSRSRSRSRSRSYSPSYSRSPSRSHRRRSTQHDRSPPSTHKSSRRSAYRSPSRSPAPRRRRSHHSRSASPPRRSHRSHRSRSRSPQRRSHRSHPSRSRSPERRSHRSHRPRSRSPNNRSRRHHHHHHRHHRDRDRDQDQTRDRSTSPLPKPHPRSRAPLPSQATAYTHDTNNPESQTPPPPKEAPNYAPTGLLAAETNRVPLSRSADPAAPAIILKYHEPPTARKPPPAHRWTLFVFKGAPGSPPLDTIPLHARSCWLFGREPAVADVLLAHPSSSAQHAVLQFRHVPPRGGSGADLAPGAGAVKLYVLDLESANGTRLNGDRLEPARYIECRSGDVLRFGDSERDYVLLLPPKE